MKDIGVSALVQEINQFVSERDWEQFHSPKNLSMALTKESSELMELYQWINEEKSIEAHKNPVFRERLSDELADVFFYLLRLTSLTEINLEEAFRHKLQKNRAKYPVEKSKGKCLKYTDL